MRKHAIKIPEAIIKATIHTKDGGAELCLISLYQILTNKRYTLLIFIISFLILWSVNIILWIFYDEWSRYIKYFLRFLTLMST